MENDVPVLELEKSADLVAMSVNDLTFRDVEDDRLRLHAHVENKTPFCQQNVLFLNVGNAKKTFKLSQDRLNTLQGKLVPIE